MAMTNKQIELVKQSWQEVAIMDASVAGQLFYTRLFETHPELKAVFKSPIPEQSKKLVTMIGYVVAKLDKLEDIAEEVRKLAQRHVRYGVKEKHYSMVGEALLWTLQKALAGAWNTELEEAWTACYTVLSGAMIAAAEEAPIA